RDSLAAVRAHVTHCEHSRMAGFEQIRTAGERPMRALQDLFVQVEPGLHETLAVQRHEALEPVAVGAGAGHREYVTDGPRRLLALRLIEPGDSLEVLFALQGYDFGSAMERDVRRLFDAADEIPRHARCEIGPADQHVNVMCGAGEKCRCLAGRV